MPKRRAAALLVFAATLAACGARVPSPMPVVAPTSPAVPRTSAIVVPTTPASRPPTPGASPTPSPVTASPMGVVDIAALFPPAPSPMPEPSCTTAARPPKALHLTVDGYPRVAYTAVPADYGSHQLPVVIALHGFDQQATDFADYTQLLTVGPQRGVIVVIPQGIGDPTGWNVPDSPEVGPSDVHYLKVLITRLTQTTCANPSQVVLAGLSDGSDMSVTAACALPNLIDGVLLVAASTGPSPTCGPQHVVQIHGTADPVDAYSGRPKDLRRGFGAVKAAGAERAFSLWSRLDGCPSSDVRTVRDLKVFRALQCARGSVSLIAVQGGGHTWPGAPPRPALGPTTTSLDTAQLLYLALMGFGAPSP